MQEGIIVKFQKQIQKNKLYATYQCTYNGVPKYLRIFDSSLPDYQLVEQSLEMTIQISQIRNNMFFRQQFLAQEIVSEKNDKVLLIQQPYQTTLQIYLKSHSIGQSEAQQIFVQVLKAVYSLQKEKFIHPNLRPQHFVKVGGNWKLSTLIFQKPKAQQQAQYEYQWNSKYQPPECYEKSQFENKQYARMVSWNLGSIYLDLLTGYHKLSDILTISKLKDTQFSLNKINIKTKISPELNTFLSQMLKYIPEERITCVNLFKKKLNFAPPLSSIFTQSVDHSDNFSSIKSESNISLQSQQDNKHQNKNILCGFSSKIDIGKQQSSDLRSLFLKSKNQVKINYPILTQELNSQECSHELIYKIYFQKLDQITFLFKLKNHIKTMLAEKLKTSLENSVFDCFELAVNFVVANSLSAFRKSLEFAKNIFNVQPKQFNSWVISNYYKVLIKQVNLSLTQMLEALNQSKKRVRKLPEDPSFKIKPNDITLLAKTACIQVEFRQIKDSYRNIVVSMFHKSRDFLNDFNQDQNSRISIMFMILLCFDKVFDENKTKKLLDSFFKSKFRKDQGMINCEEIQNYIMKSDGETLIENAHHMYSQCFRKSSEKFQIQSSA